MKMELLLRRKQFNEGCTTGELLLDGKYLCDTLEDTFRELPAVCPDTVIGVSCHCKEKDYGDTCIPAGRYEVVYSHSPKFGRKYPRLLNVPHFIGILIHGGRNAGHTEGCILVGTLNADGESLRDQFKARDMVCEAVKKACEAGKKVFITIE